ncbi:MAG: beta-carotene hydroxylase [Halieaceae bacterium]|jgi:beta-carotene hydroxylase|nr:beta-carotene hydroxylase [Halieaceae bacterium]
MSLAEERQIAQRYIGGFPLLMVVWGLGGFILWLVLWPLAILGVIPLWLGGVVATIILSACYLPSHEAEHGNIGRPKKPFRWLNELTGHLSMFPLLIPYRLHRAIHLKHHAHANDPIKDPDYHNMAENILGAIRQAWLGSQPGFTGALKDQVLEDSVAKDKLVLEALVVTRIAWFAMAVLAVSGFALQLFALWWLPRQIAMIYTVITLSWAPHHPGQETGRYRDTRGWVSPVGTILSSGMEYHLVHHLFPSIPLNKTPAAYRELKPLLEKEGMALNGL